jgi:hypothetical protein
MCVACDDLSRPQIERQTGWDFYGINRISFSHSIHYSSIFFGFDRFLEIIEAKQSEIFISHQTTKQQL